jgi:hypothetical protein
MTHQATFQLSLAASVCDSGQIAEGEFDGLVLLFESMSDDPRTPPRMRQHFLRIAKELEQTHLVGPEDVELDSETHLEHLDDVLDGEGNISWQDFMLMLDAIAHAVPEDLRGAWRKVYDKLDDIVDGKCPAGFPVVDDTPEWEKPDEPEADPIACAPVEVDGCLDNFKVINETCTAELPPVADAVEPEDDELEHHMPNGWVVVRRKYGVVFQREDKRGKVEPLTIDGGSYRGYAADASGTLVKVGSPKDGLYLACLAVDEAVRRRRNKLHLAGRA